MTAFAEQLATWGPDAPPRRVSLDEAEAYCRKLATSHYENFPVASYLLPRRLHRAFHAIYAYCRWADDLGDEVPDAALALDLLAWWRGELQRCFAGEARHPVFVALRPVLAEFGIPQGPFEDLISAFEQDQRVRDYQSYLELLDYCRRSANPVGRLVLYLFRQATTEHFVWSDSICTGLQLANFWQDVARDFDMGRVYLPLEDRERFGYGPEQLARRETNAQFLNLMRFEVARARACLTPWDHLPRPSPRLFPWRFRVEIDVLARGGLLILDRLEQIGFRVWDVRPTLRKSDVARLLAASAWQQAWRTFDRDKHHPIV